MDAIGLLLSHGLHSPWIPVLCAHGDVVYVLTKGCLGHAEKVGKWVQATAGWLEDKKKRQGCPHIL